VTTVRVKLCVASGEIPFVAVMVNVNTPAAVGVPLRDPPELKVTPVGSGPGVENVGAGKPLAVTGNVLLEPKTKVALAPLVKFGAASTDSVAVFDVVPVPPSVELTAPVVLL